MRILPLAALIIFLGATITGCVDNQVTLRQQAIVAYVEDKCDLASPERIAEFDIEYARTKSGALTTRPLFTGTVIKADVTIDCKEVNDWKNRNSKKARKAKQWSDDSEFTVCLESEKYSQDCVEIDLTDKKTKSLFDLCKDSDTILLKEVDSSKIVELSCE